jgi:hypothetical protein
MGAEVDLDTWQQARLAKEWFSASNSGARATTGEKMSAGGGRAHVAAGTLRLVVEFAENCRQISRE